MAHASRCNCHQETEAQIACTHTCSEPAMSAMAKQRYMRLALRQNVAPASWECELWQGRLDQASGPPCRAGAAELNQNQQEGPQHAVQLVMCCSSHLNGLRAVSSSCFQPSCWHSSRKAKARDSVVTCTGMRGSDCHQLKTCSMCAILVIWYGIVTLSLCFSSTYSIFAHVVSSSTSNEQRACCRWTCAA